MPTPMRPVVTIESSMITSSSGIEVSFEMPNAERVKNPTKAPSM